MKINLNVGKKIALGYAVALLLFIIVGVVTYRNTTLLVQSNHWVEHTHKVIDGVNAVLSDLKDAETGQRGYLLTGEAKYLEPYTAALKDIAVSTRRIRELTVDNKNQQLRMDKLEPLINQKLDELKETIALRNEKGFEAALSVVRTDEGKQVMEDIRRITTEMEVEERGLLEQRNQKADKSASNSQLITILLVIVAIVLMIIIGSLIAQNISKPLITMTGLVDQISEGDLNIELQTNHRGDEVGKLASSFAKMHLSLNNVAIVAKQISDGNLSNEITPKSVKDIMGQVLATMVINLRKQIQEIREGVAVLISTSSEISATLSQLIAASEETAASVTETSATVEEVNQSAKLSSEKAKRVSEDSKVTFKTSQLGEEAMNETIKGMESIKDHTESIAENIVMLSEQSQFIGEIISTVESLAEQSNLLAVNASIEAAKAGDQGRGFAVVAQEVKSLADRSKEATSKVRGILNDIQKATSAAVMATEQGGKVVDIGLDKAITAGSAIRDLARNIEEATNAAVQIAASSQQQFVGMDQIRSATRNIKEATTQSIAGARQLQVSVKDLENFTQKLQVLVEQYKL
ncbi:MAG: methyl-accepting chemotaxis protein [Bacteroidales bacterium]|nr:methyl-accepting chemotaxis protein [Bacteroidales bacterium]